MICEKYAAYLKTNLSFSPCIDAAYFSQIAYAHEFLVSKTMKTVCNFDLF